MRAYTDAQKSDAPGRECKVCGEDTVRVFLLQDVATGQTRVSLLCRPCLVEYLTIGGEVKGVHLVGDVTDRKGEVVQ